MDSPVKSRDDHFPTFLRLSPGKGRGCYIGANNKVGPFLRFKRFF